MYDWLSGGDRWDRENRDVVGWMIFIGHCLKVKHGGEKRLERFNTSGQVLKMDEGAVAAPRQKVTQAGEQGCG